MFRTNKLFAVAVSSLVAIATLPQAARAVITVGTYTSAATLNLNGYGTTIMAKDTGGSGNLLVGGVTFSTPDPVFTANGFTYSSASFGDANLNTLSNSNALYFANVNAPSYNTSLTGLTPGLNYNFKIILFDGDIGTNNSQARGFSTFTFHNGAPANDESVTYNYYDVVSGTIGTTPATPGSFFAGKGMKIDYTFTAQDTSIGITLTPAQDHYMIPSAFTLETQVPEPASLSLLALGGVAVLRRSSRRR